MKRVFFCLQAWFFSAAFQWLDFKTTLVRTIKFSISFIHCINIFNLTANAVRHKSAAKSGQLVSLKDRAIVSNAREKTLWQINDWRYCQSCCHFAFADVFHLKVHYEIRKKNPASRTLLMTSYDKSGFKYQLLGNCW